MSKIFINSIDDRIFIFRQKIKYKFICHSVLLMQKKHTTLKLYGQRESTCVEKFIGGNCLID